MTSEAFLAGAPGPWKMANPVREYDWGSTGALAALQGREPSGRPEAELWMGAHPAAPSSLRQPDGSEVSLAAAIHANPVAVLGRECMARFGGRMPFLLKVLAAARDRAVMRARQMVPLSAMLQSHLIAQRIISAALTNSPFP